MGKIVRALSQDGSVLCIAIDSTDIVNEIFRIHRTSPVVSAALGRTATAAAIMGSLMKNDTDSLTLRISGGGPCGQIIAVSDWRGNVKCTVQNPLVDLPLKPNGKLDVGACVGTDGFLAVVRDLGLKEPYCGQVPIVSGEIAEDITSYYAVSEQIPTVCALGVLVDRDYTIKHAGGFIVQLVPPVAETAIDIIEKNVSQMASVTTMLEQGITPEDIVFKALDGFNPEILDTWETAYKCDCSRERMERALISIGKKDLESLAAEQENTELVCHFCNSAYNFTRGEIKALLERAAAK